MYATLSLKRLIQVLTWPLGIILLLYVVIRGVPTDPWAGVRMIGTVITIWGLVLIVFGGFSCSAGSRVSGPYGAYCGRSYLSSTRRTFPI